MAGVTEDLDVFVVNGVVGAGCGVGLVVWLVIHNAAETGRRL